MSFAFISSGITFSNSLICTSNSGFPFASSLAIASFSLTFPDKYSSAVIYLFSSASELGILNICPSNSFSISSSVLSVIDFIYSISTFAFSVNDNISASFAVSTFAISFFALIVFFVNISAFLLKLPVESNISNEHNK